MGFWKKYLGIKAEKVNTSLQSLAANEDTDDAILASILVKQEDHEELVKMVEAARLDYDKEQRDVVNNLADQDMILAGLEILQEDLITAEAAGNAEEAAFIQADIDGAIEKVTALQEDLAREEEEAAYAKQALEELEADAAAAAAERDALQAQANTLKKKLKSTEQAVKRAEKLKEQRERAKGLRSDNDKSKVAFDALEKRIRENEINAAAATKVAESLKPIKESDRLADAMKRAKTGQKPEMSSAERIAALQANRAKK